MRAILEAYIDFGDDHPEMYQLVHERHVPGFEPSAEALSESIHLTELGVAALKSWVDRGAAVTQLTAEETFDLVIGCLARPHRRARRRQSRRPQSSGQVSAADPGRRRPFRGGAGATEVAVQSARADAATHRQRQAFESRQKGGCE